MEAQVRDVDGQDTVPSDTYHLGNDPDGSMDVAHAGIWDIDQALA